MALESGTDKVKEICEILRNETIQPAKDEALRIIADANAEAEAIVAKANEDADDIMNNLKRDLEKMQSVANASIELAIKQGIAKLRQLVMDMFNDELHALADEKMKDTEVMVKLVDALVVSIEKEGIKSDLEAVIGKDVSKEDLIGKLASNVREKLEKGGVELGQFHAGVVIKMVDKRMAIEMTDKAVVELISTYISDELREKLFRLG